MKDVIIQGMLADGGMRFSAISGRQMVTDAKNTHGLSLTATAALGRQLLMTAMLAAQLKNEADTVSTVLSGGGAGGNLVSVGRFGGLVKGYCANPGAELPPLPTGKLNVGGFVGKDGKLTVIRDLGLKDPYVGTCRLVSGEIAEDYAQYFTVSEQQPSLVYLGVRIDTASGQVLSAGGVLLQTMPGCPDEVIDKAIALAPFVEDFALRLQDGETPEGILRSIFGRMGCTFTNETEPAYRCDCSRERMETALIAVGRDELADILKTDKQAELVCHFCNKKYRFSEENLAQLLASLDNTEDEE